MLVKFDAEARPEITAAPLLSKRAACTALGIQGIARIVHLQLLFFTSNNSSIFNIVSIFLQ